MDFILASDTADLSVWQNLSKTFHINGPYFTAQLINFLLVLFVLWKFAFGPIQEMLEQRKQRIADGEAKLADIEQQLAESEKTTAEAIAKANEDAQRLIEEAQQNADKLTEREAQRATASAQGILAKAEEAATAERNAMKAELKAEFGKLLTSATTQVTGKVLSDDDQRRINEESMTSLPN